MRISALYGTLWSSKGAPNVPKVNSAADFFWLGCKFAKSFREGGNEGVNILII